MSDSLFDLPGPRRFARGLEHRIEQGATSVVLLPRAAAPRGLKRAVLPRASLEQVRALRLSYMAGAHPIAVRLADALDLQRSIGARIDVTSLATAKSLGRRVVWVEADARASPDLVEEWLDFAGQFAQAAKNVPVADRPTLVTVLAGQPLPATVGRADIDVVWWWGVLDRLDTSVYVAERTFGNSAMSSDMAAMVVELAGHDLSLADVLVESWRGDADHACELLADHAHQRGWNGSAVPTSVGRQGPPEDGLEAWNSGALERWLPDSPSLHVACDSSLERAVRGRIWRAQIQTVYPQVEQLRQSLAGWIAMNIDHLPSRWRDADPFDFEIGVMKDVIESTGVLRHDKSRLKAAKWAARVRDRLSHLDAITTSELAEGTRLLASVAALR